MNSLQTVPIFLSIILVTLLPGQTNHLQAVSPDEASAPTDALLEELVRDAVLRNPGLEAQFETWKAALLRIPQVRALPEPRLNFGNFIRSIETRVGPQHQRIGLSQTFPWFGKLRLRGEMAALDAEAAFQQFESERQRITYEVIDDYHELGYLHRAMETVGENIQLLKQLEGVAQARLQAGGSYLGVVKAQVELGKLEDRLRSLEEMLHPIRAGLNALLGRVHDAPLPKPEFVASPALGENIEQLFVQLKHESPLLKSMQARIEGERNGLQLARRNAYPDITLGVDYVTTGDAVNPATTGNGRDAVLATFSINLPLWRHKLRAEIQEAEARGMAAQARRNDMELRLEARLQKALYEYGDAERKISLYRDSLVPQAKSALSVAQKAFEGGTADFLETVDAQRLLLDFQLQVERSIATREQRLAEIGMILGGGITLDSPPMTSKSP